MSQMRLLIAMFLLMLSACIGSDPEHIEYFPQADGNKPDIFELGFVQVCEDGPTAVRSATRFAERYGMSEHDMVRPGSRILAVFTYGLPMRAHVMVERVYKDRYRVGVSTFRGYSTEIVKAAHNYSFCSASSAPPNNSFKPKPLPGSA